MKKGQIVYCDPGGNSRSKDIVEGVVKKIGRKYITIEIQHSLYRFDKVSLQQITEYCTDYYIYLDKQTILDKREHYTLYTKLRNIVNCHEDKLNLDKLRKIMEIINS